MKKWECGCEGHPNSFAIIILDSSTHLVLKILAPRAASPAGASANDAIVN